MDSRAFIFFFPFFNTVLKSQLNWGINLQSRAGIQPRDPLSSGFWFRKCPHSTTVPRPSAWTGKNPFLISAGPERGFPLVAIIKHDIFESWGTGPGFPVWEKSPWSDNWQWIHPRARSSPGNHSTARGAHPGGPKPSKNPPEKNAHLIYEPLQAREQILEIYFTFKAKDVTEPREISHSSWHHGSLFQAEGHARQKSWQNVL